MYICICVHEWTEKNRRNDRMREGTMESEREKWKRSGNSNNFRFNYFFFLFLLQEITIKIFENSFDAVQ